MLEQVTKLFRIKIDVDLKLMQPNQSPEYLAQHGTPQHPEDLRDHNCLTYIYSPTANLWAFTEHGRDINVQVKGTLRANSGDMSRMAAVNGLGITVLPCFSICDELRDGKLVEILQGYPIPELTVYAVYLPAARRAARVKVMVEYLWEMLGRGNPPWS
jgi:DNA-binding transcriptional LysR family regulator